MKPSYPVELLLRKFDALFKNIPLQSNASCFDVMPDSKLSEHRSNWYKNELWRLNVSNDSGDTLLASDDESSGLVTASGDRLRRSVSLYCYTYLNVYAARGQVLAPMLIPSLHEISSTVFASECVKLLLLASLHSHFLR